MTRKSSLFVLLSVLQFAFGLLRSDYFLVRGSNSSANSVGSSSLPTSRSQFAYSLFPGSNQIWLYGGIRSGTNSYFGDHWLLLNSPSWTAFSDTTSAVDNPGECLVDPFLPPSLQSPGSWSTQLYFYLFGGRTKESQTRTGIRSDFWQYSINDGTWTVSSSSIQTTCQSNPAVVSTWPAARFGHSTWMSGNNLYMFGGQSTTGFINDIWKWDGAVWSLVSSCSSTNGSYVSFGVASNSSCPAGRAFAASWFDSQGTFWVYGGQTTTGILSDFWKFNQNGWTWISGTNTTNFVAPTSGILGQACSTNYPGTRQGGSSWPASDGLWLYGGEIQVNVTNGYLNDLWFYEFTSKLWTKVSGDNGTDNPGNYNSTLGVVFPGARAFAALWSTIPNRFSLFGGRVIYGPTNDQWGFNISGSFEICPVVTTAQATTAVPTTAQATTAQATTAQATTAQATTAQATTSQSTGQPIATSAESTNVQSTTGQVVNGNVTVASSAIPISNSNSITAAVSYSNKLIANLAMISTLLFSWILLF